MVGVEPSGDFRQRLDVLHRANPAAQIADVHGFRILLTRHRVPLLPDLQDALHVHGVILSIQGTRRVGSIRRHAANTLAIHALATLAMTYRQASCAWPAVGEKS